MGKTPQAPIELWLKGVIKELARKISKLYYVDEGCMGLLDKNAT